jgi:hypothetical protein
MITTATGAVATVRAIAGLRKEEWTVRSIQEFFAELALANG